MADLDIDAAISALDEEEAETFDPQSALDALDALGDSDAGDGPSMDPALADLLARNPDIEITGDVIDDPRVPIGGGLGYDVSGQVRRLPHSLHE